MATSLGVALSYYSGTADQFREVHLLKDGAGFAGDLPVDGEPAYVVVWAGFSHWRNPDVGWMEVEIEGGGYSVRTVVQRGSECPWKEPGHLCSSGGSVGGIVLESLPDDPIRVRLSSDRPLELAAVYAASYDRRPILNGWLATSALREPGVLPIQAPGGEVRHEDLGPSLTTIAAWTFGPLVLAVVAGARGALLRRSEGHPRWPAWAHWTVWGILGIVAGLWLFSAVLG